MTVCIYLNIVYVCEYGFTSVLAIGLNKINPALNRVYLVHFMHSFQKSVRRALCGAKSQEGLETHFVNLPL